MSTMEIINALTEVQIKYYESSEEKDMTSGCEDQAELLGGHDI